MKLLFLKLDSFDFGWTRIIWIFLLNVDDKRGWDSGLMVFHHGWHGNAAADCGGGRQDLRHKFAAISMKWQ